MKKESGFVCDGRFTAYSALMRISVFLVAILFFNYKSSSNADFFSCAVIIDISNAHLRRLTI